MRSSDRDWDDGTTEFEKVIGVQSDLETRRSNSIRLVLPSGRRLRRIKTLHIVAGRRTAGLRLRLASHPFRAAVLLACVGLVLFAPLLLDDSMFRTAHVLRPSEDTITIDGVALISEHPAVKLTSGTISLPPSMTGKARTGEALAALVKGGYARMALRSPVFVVTLAGGPKVDDGSAGQPGGPDLVRSQGRSGSEPSPLIEALQGGAFETLVVRDGIIVFDVGAGRSLTLTGLEADIGIKRKSMASLKGSVLLNGETIRFDLVVGARVARGRSARVPIKGKVGNALFQAAIDGQLDVTNGVALAATQVELTVPNVRSLARSLGHVWPSGPGLKDFVARGTLDWSGPTLDMTRGRYLLDGNEATGTLSVTLHPERAQVAGTLAFGAIDLTPYTVATPVPVVPAPPEVAPGPQLADEPVVTVVHQLPAPATPQRMPPPQTLLAALATTPDVRWPMLGLVDADLRLSAERVRLDTFEAGQSAASLTIRAGQLVLNVAEMLVADGARGVFEFGISGTAAYPNYLLRGRLEDANLASVSQILTGVALVRAKGQVVFDLTSSGISGTDLLSRVAGKVDVGMPEGGLIACNHRSLALSAKSAQAVAERPAGDVCGSSVAVAPVAVGAKLNSGLVIVDKFDVMADDELVSLKGTFDLVTSGIDVALTAGPMLPPRSDGNRPDPLRTDRSVMTVRGRPDALEITAIP